MVLSAFVSDQVSEKKHSSVIDTIQEERLRQITVIAIQLVYIFWLINGKNIKWLN